MNNNKKLGALLLGLGGAALAGGLYSVTRKDKEYLDTDVEDGEECYYEVEDSDDETEETE